MRFSIGLLILAGGYLVGAIGGYFMLLAANPITHDATVAHAASVEAATSAAFLIGPAVAVFAIVTGLPLLRRR